MYAKLSAYHTYVQEEEQSGSTEAMYSGYAVLKTIMTLLEIVPTTEDVYAAMEQHLYPFFNYMLSREDDVLGMP